MKNILYYVRKRGINLTSYYRMYFKYTNKLNYETNNYAIIMLNSIIEKKISHFRNLESTRKV